MQQHHQVPPPAEFAHVPWGCEVFYHNHLHHGHGHGCGHGGGGGGGGGGPATSDDGPPIEYKPAAWRDFGVPVPPKEEGAAKSAPLSAAAAAEEEEAKEKDRRGALLRGMAIARGLCGAPRPVK